MQKPHLKVPAGRLESQVTYYYSERGQASHLGLLWHALSTEYRAPWNTERNFELVLTA